MANAKISIISEALVSQAGSVALRALWATGSSQLLVVDNCCSSQLAGLKIPALAVLIIHLEV